MKKTTLKLLAVFEIDEQDADIIDSWRVEDLEHIIWEIKELKRKVTFQSGQIRGTLRIMHPTPYELKAARVKAQAAPQPDARADGS